jgi:hypothetical protein
VPFLRVIRDKRGYETSYLMHWFRDGGRQQSRILYVFRTPGGVRVGRPALDPDVLREIEAEHPDIDFDWQAVLENKQVVEPPAERRPRKKKRGDEEGGAAPAASAPATQADPNQKPRFVVPSKIEGETPDAQVAFLGQWHRQIRDQILERVTDEGRRDALLALTDRLNPAAWIDADEVTVGLQHAAEALERLSHVFAKRRRRTRKKKPGQPTAGTDEAPTRTDPAPDRTDQ